MAGSQERKLGTWLIRLNVGWRCISAINVCRALVIDPRASIAETGGSI
jgi:hypothetical protein